MKRRTRFNAFGAGLLSGAMMFGGIGAIAPAAAAEPATILSADFEDGTLGGWEQSGGPALSVVDLDGESVLRVADRANDFDGIQSPVGALAGLEPGSDYTFSMRAKLAEGTAGGAGVRFVVTPGYTWVGNTTMTAASWTTVSGTFTVPTGSDTSALRVFLGTGNLDPVATYTYLVDDIVVSGVPADGEEAGDGPPAGFVPGGAVEPVATPVSAARGDGNVSALTFDDGPNGADTSALLDFLKERELPATFCVIGENIEAPGGAELLRRMVAEGHTLCNHSTDYRDMGSLSADEVEEKLLANLEIIRTALGDPAAAVPFFRAPNGSWGQTQPVAVSLGMQPLAVTNTIGDWETQDVATLTDRLRAAMTPGELVLVHDGGGDRAGSLEAVTTVVTERLADGWTFALPVGAPDAPQEPGGSESLDFDFEDGLQGWIPRGTAGGDPAVTVTTGEAHSGSQAALVSGRASQGDGIARDVTGALTPGTSYVVTAWVKFAAGQDTDAVWLTLARTEGGATSYDTLGQFTGVTAGEWTEVRATFQASDSDAALLYFETNYNGTNTSDFLVDDVRVAPQASGQVQGLEPIKETVDFPVGVAIDSRETAGAAAELTTRHFGQLTSENYMKPEAWYAADGTFRPHPEVDSLMTFAQDEDLDVYGHTLVWHSQTPAWFFDDASGADLTASPADQQVLRDRMRTHIFAVAESLSDSYGAFGSDSNPITAFDVVNEVVADGSDFADGLRRSEWYRILGEEFIDLSFQYADEAFNGEFAADGSDRPVTLFINDYNTEQDGKQSRLLALVERMLDRGVPLDGVGHQFHVSLATPISALETAIATFTGLGLTQAVTELDVTTGVPETDAKFVDQGYYYRDAFRIFRTNSAELFSVTLWGLTDGRSWRAASGGPLAFDDAFQAKPAYYGIVDSAELPARLRAANVFAGDVALDAAATTAGDWERLPLNLIEDTAGFQLRWAPDHLTVYVTVEDTTAEGSDGVEFDVDGVAVAVARDGSGDVEAVVTETDGGYTVVAHLPLSPTVAQGDAVEFDARVLDGDTTAGWNSPGAVGTLTLIEELSFVEVAEAAAAPAIDGEIEEVWADARTVSTSKQVEGEGGASAEFRTLWNGSTLYVLAEVTDPTIDVSGSDPWIQDSVEIYLDAGNYKNGSYRYDDSQIRISAENVVSVGTGDEAFQLARLETETRAVDGGYVVEAAISLLEEGGAGTFQGMDFQVNDASNGARTGIRNWADPSGAGYQSTARWGVGELVGAVGDPGPGTDPGTDPGPGADPGPGTGTGTGDGTGTGTGTGDGTGTGTGPTGGSDGPADGRGAERGDLAFTGADALPTALIAALLLGLGLLLVVRRRRPAGARPE